MFSDTFSQNSNYKGFKSKLHSHQGERLRSSKFIIQFASVPTQKWASDFMVASLA